MLKFCICLVLCKREMEDGIPVHRCILSMNYYRISEANYLPTARKKFYALCRITSLVILYTQRAITESRSHLVMACIFVRFPFIVRLKTFIKLGAIEVQSTAHQYLICPFQQMEGLMVQLLITFGFPKHWKCLQFNCLCRLEYIAR